MKDSLIKRIFVAAVVLVLASLTMTVWFLCSLAKGIGNADQEYKGCVGQEVVMGLDTLKVVDYNLLERTFTLTDGTEVNSTMVFDERLKEVK
jgi:hypothetical protein